MKNKSNYDFLYLVWTSPKNKKQFFVGKLIKSDKNYKFEYLTNLERAKKEGFKPLVEFPDVKEVYFSKELFQTFASRLPDKRRKDMPQILKKYGLKKFDQYELLKKCKGKLPIDNYEFIPSLF